MKAATSLGYQIISCSSEDSTHPISSIINSSINSTGWQTSPNPRYPVEFVVDLTTVVELETLQFVSHQFKIANRVDLYVAKSDKDFKALGSFNFSNNAHSNYTSRELKSATLNGIKAQFIKIVIPGCHANPNNPTNQIGIVSFNVLGCGGVPKSSVPKAMGSNGLDGDSSDILEQLERQKREAVEKEDFKRAEVLKKQIERLRRAYDQVVVLQQQKKDAIAREDFVTAQKLKAEIDYLLNGSDPTRDQSMQNQPPPRQSINQQSFQYQDQYQNPPQNRTSFNIPEDDLDEQPIQERRRQLPQKTQKLPPKPAPEPEEPPPRRQSRPLEDEIPPAVQRNFGEDRRPKNVDIAAFEANAQEDEPLRRNRHQIEGANPDERPIHPSKEAGASNPSPRGGGGGGGGRDLQKEPDELSGTNKSEAGCLVDIVSERLVACFFSKVWNLKIDGIKEIANRLVGDKTLSASQKGDAFYRYCYIMRHRVVEDHKAVFSASLEGIKLLGEKLGVSQSDFSRGMQQVVPPLQPKIGCSQQILSKQTCKFLRWVVSKGCADCVIPMLIKSSSKPQQWKAPLAQLSTLHKIVLAKEGDYASLGLSLDQIMNFIVPNLESAAKEVRDAAIEFVVTMNILVGTAVERFMEKVNPRIRKEIDEKIKANQEAE